MHLLRALSKKSLSQENSGYSLMMEDHTFQWSFLLWQNCLHPQVKKYEVKSSYFIEFFLFTEAPAPPSNLRVIRLTEDSCTLEWSPSWDDGGSPLTGYVVQHRDHGCCDWIKVYTFAPRTNCATIRGLVYDEDYYFRVFAENEVGRSDPCELPSTVRPFKPYGKSSCYIS